MYRRFFILLALGFVAAILPSGCKSPAPVETSGTGVIRTDPQYLDPEIDSAFLTYLLNNSTSIPQNAMHQGHNQIQWLPDSSDAMANYAESFVSDDSATHIPYVWGGKQIDQPTEWSTYPHPAAASNQNGCSARIGLDCSGFVGLVLKHFGVRPNVAEVSVAGLVNSENWKNVKKAGYDLIYFGHPKVENLLPGDILIFTDNVGNLVHTGIFYSQHAKFASGTQPGFINSTGHIKCSANYALEAQGKLTGVMLSPFGPITEARTLFAIRITREYVRFTIDGRDYEDFHNTNTSALLDTTSHDFSFSAASDTSGVHAYLRVRAVGVTGKGTYTIPEMSYDSVLKYSNFRAIPDSLSNYDSVWYFATTPPSWWQGSNPPATGGQLKIETLAHDNNGGTAAGTFSLKGNAYWYRYEDSTYYQDSLKFTTQVKKYYVRQREVKGRFEGYMWLQ
jgi:cell wall-associated NlpC family hydrolase